MPQHRNVHPQSQLPRPWQPVRVMTTGVDEHGDPYEEHRTLRPPEYLDGRHVSTFVDDVRRLKRAGDLAAAAALLERICARLLHGAPDLPPWYFAQLAIVYRRQQRYSDEVQLLERYLAATPRPTTVGARFPQRLAKARALIDNRTKRST